MGDRNTCRACQLHATGVCDLHRREELEAKNAELEGEVTRWQVALRKLNEDLRGKLLAAHAEQHKTMQRQGMDDLIASTAITALKEDYQGACKTIAEMHAAAVGEVTGPNRGVVEDVADLRSDMKTSRNRNKKLSDALMHAEREVASFRKMALWLCREAVDDHFAESFLGVAIGDDNSDEDWLKAVAAGMKT